MKRLGLIVLLVSLITGSALASNTWYGSDQLHGYWSDANGWSRSYVPVDTEDVKIIRPNTGVIVDTNAGTWANSRIYMASGPTIADQAEMWIVDGGYLDIAKDWNIGDAGATGNGDIATVTQSGGQVNISSSGNIAVGRKAGGEGYYIMYGGQMTGDGDLFVGAAGADGSKGEFRVVGTGPSINVGRLYVASSSSAGDNAGTGTLAFKICHTVSKIVVAGTVSIDANEIGTAILDVNSTVSAFASHYVLVERTDTGGIQGDFDTILDYDGAGSGAEGSTVVLFNGTTTKNYTITYTFDAGGDGQNNDIALIPEPATVGLLGLGGLLAFRRRKK